MKPVGIHMVWVTVEDINQAKIFFGQQLGMTLTADAPEHQWAEFATPQGTLIGVSGSTEHSPIKPGDNAVICITVEDAVTAKQELEAEGVHCWDIHEIPGHVKMFFVQDPSKNYYHIVQRLD